MLTHEFPCFFNIFSSSFDQCLYLVQRTGSDEQKFLEASMAYVSGKPIMNDKEFDQLKLRLKVCYFHFINEMKNRIVTGDMQARLKTTSL